MAIVGSHNIKYTKAEEWFIEDNYLNLSDQDLGEKFNRTARAISGKRREMGLYRNAKLSEVMTISIEVNPIIIKDVEKEIAALVNFIETTHSEVWREIANVRRLTLVRTLIKI